MRKSVNKVILVGNVGKDPEVKYSPSGTPIAKFSLATNERFKDRSGEWQERVEWHTIVAWHRLAEIAGSSLQATPRFTSRESCRHRAGKTVKAAKPGTGQRS